MKKSLFAIAAVTAFAGAAQAQSSVTVYGILDVGFAGTTSRTTTVTSGGSAAQGGNKANTTAFSGAGSETTSRLGFRGTEDLGGGTAAFFTAEFALAPTDMNLSGNANGGLFNRQTFLGLSQKGIGRAAIGTQYTPIHLAVGATDPGQQNNMIGSIIYATSAAQGNGQTTTSYTVRQNQAITFGTENIAGFTLSAMYANGNADRTQTGVLQTTTTAGGTVNSTGYGLGANYVWKKLFATANYQSFKNETDNSTAQVLLVPTTTGGAALPADPARGVAGTTTVVSGLGTATTNGLNITDNQFYAAAVYDFGILKAYVNYINRKAISNFDSNTYVSRTGQQIGVRSFITPKIEGWANAGTGRYNAFDTSTATANFTAYQLGGNYWLSKRTNMYAIYGATMTSSTGVATSANSSAGASSYALGLRHTF